ncbi:uncharacterized protein LOC18424307 [Amborella trichopoda]|uniref:Uncharacterized protein n=1 Tax=Amborella trichopoda TaxID=13333 RepID=W1NMA8_AMBTC|nr:uncharacterized protein LOC18424307 [Amborella trichopoda]ERM96375.1 hypothetical protein AMTR_s00001p00233350 [Amborella trichopoda]|eukprot:XP_006828959.1 uncharacterized protein LOC18424307 [Amborella trichopoda]
MDAPLSFHVRSNSLPFGSYPILRQLSEKVLRFSNCESNPQCHVYFLSNLYNDLDGLLQLQLSGEAIRHDDKFVSEMLDDTLTLLDACSRMGDAISCLREQHRDLLSAFRRRAYIGLECQISAYISAQKKIAKISAKCLSILQKDHKTQHQQSAVDNEVLCALKQVRSITIFVYEFLLSRFIEPRKRHSIISSILKPKLQKPNGVWESAKAALNALYTSSGKLDDLCVKDAQRQLELWDECMTNMDNQLGCISSHLIRTRVALLNILTM